MLISDKQHQANLENAQKSTGPRTPSGKRASSRNALTHGALAAAAEAVAELGESAGDLAELEAALLDEYQQPPAPHVRFLVLELAACIWKLRRLGRVEASHYRAAIATRVGVVLGRVRPGLPLQPNPNLVGEAYHQSVDTLDKLSRQEARLRSHYLRLLRQLEMLATQTNPKPLNPCMLPLMEPSLCPVPGSS